MTNTGNRTPLTTNRQQAAANDPQHTNKNFDHQPKHTYICLPKTITTATKIPALPRAINVKHKIDDIVPDQHTIPLGAVLHILRERRKDHGAVLSSSMLSVHVLLICTSAARARSCAST